MTRPPGVEKKASDRSADLAGGKKRAAVGWMEKGPPSTELPRPPKRTRSRNNCYDVWPGGYIFSEADNISAAGAAYNKNRGRLARAARTRASNVGRGGRVQRNRPRGALQESVGGVALPPPPPPQWLPTDRRTHDKDRAGSLPSAAAAELRRESARRAPRRLRRGL